ncbi:MAG TPA: tungstate ABC transporter substrate-binding protein WtpA [Armatimonadetes bacterium]|nr:tungstate ABC transporter substrate-binding protein WtpA [Armatimonadota bacterium]
MRNESLGGMLWHGFSGGIGGANWLCKVVIFIALLGLVVGGGCGGRSRRLPSGPRGMAKAKGPKGKVKLIVFHAGSLAVPLREAEREFERRHPNVDVVREASGSRAAARKVCDLKRVADVVALADYAVIEDLLMPKYAKWYVVFARNRMVIAYTVHSKYADEIGPENWFEILARPDVRFGRSDPNLDPAGYRTLMVWQLADLYYKRKVKGKSIYEALISHPGQRIRPGSVQLLPLLESLDIDYAFEYQSVAMQHNLRFVKLPPQIDLGDERFADFYRKARVEVTGKEPGKKSVYIGTPILYGVTIPTVSRHPELAVEFVKLLVSEEGRKILRRCFQEPVVPAFCPSRFYDALPEGIKPLVTKGILPAPPEG